MPPRFIICSWAFLRLGLWDFCWLSWCKPGVTLLLCFGILGSAVMGVKVQENEGFGS